MALGHRIEKTSNGLLRERAFADYDYCCFIHLNFKYSQNIGSWLQGIT